MIRAVLFPLLLSACQLAIPDDLRACRESVPVPAALPRVRNVTMMAGFAIRLELAREKERARGDDCAERLRRLNDLVSGRK